MSQDVTAIHYCDAACLSSANHLPCHGGNCLVDAARRREAPAADRLFSRLAVPVRRQARWLCPCAEDAEDLTQTALAHVVEKLDQLRDNSRLLGWTWRIVLNAHRMSSRRSKFAPATVEEFNEWRHSGQAAGPLAGLVHRELEANLAPLMSALPPRLHAVARLRLLDGPTTSETARALRITSEAVRTRLRRARILLRSALAYG